MKTLITLVEYVNLNINHILFVTNRKATNIHSFTIGTDAVSRILSLRYLFVFSSKSEHKRENVLENLKQIHFVRAAIPLKILKNSLGLQFFVKTDTYKCSRFVQCTHLS